MRVQRSSGLEEMLAQLSDLSRSEPVRWSDTTKQVPSNEWEAPS